MPSDMLANASFLRKTCQSEIRSSSFGTCGPSTGAQRLPLYHFNFDSINMKYYFYTSYGICMYIYICIYICIYIYVYIYVCMYVYIYICGIHATHMRVRKRFSAAY